MAESQAPAQAVEDPFAGQRRNWRIRSPKTLVATLSVLLLFIVLGIFGSQIAPEDPFKLNLVGRLQPPFFATEGNLDHPLGTDDLGRDTLSRLIYGARISLLAIVMVIPLATVIGSILGILAGWFGGWTSRVIMALVDLQLAMPAILIAVFLRAIWEPSLSNVVIVLVFALWATFARLVEARLGARTGCRAERRRGSLPDRGHGVHGGRVHPRDPERHRTRALQLTDLRRRHREGWRGDVPLRAPTHARSFSRRRAALPCRPCLGLEGARVSGTDSGYRDRSNGGRTVNN